jgi:hypothetical protein
VFTTPPKSPLNITYSGFVLPMTVGTVANISCIAVLKDVPLTPNLVTDWSWRSWCPMNRDGAPSGIYAVSEVAQLVNDDHVGSTINMEFCGLMHTMDYTVYCAYRLPNGELPAIGDVIAHSVTVSTPDGTPPSFLGVSVAFNKPPFAFPPPEDCISSTLCLTRHSGSSGNIHTSIYHLPH